MTAGYGKDQAELRANKLRRLIDARQKIVDEKQRKVNILRAELEFIEMGAYGSAHYLRKHPEEYRAIDQMATAPQPPDDQMAPSALDVRAIAGSECVEGGSV